MQILLPFLLGLAVPTVVFQLHWCSVTLVCTVLLLRRHMKTFTPSVWPCFSPWVLIYAKFVHALIFWDVSVCTVHLHHTQRCAAMKATQYNSRHVWACSVANSHHSGCVSVYICDKSPQGSLLIWSEWIFSKARVVCRCTCVCNDHGISSGMSKDGGKPLVCGLYRTSLEGSHNLLCRW